jgi:small subunit ribosomal protein S2
MVDTNSDPREVNYVIPANDDATKSIDKILTIVVDAIGQGLKERKNEKEAQEQEKQAKEKAETDPSTEPKKVDESDDESASETKPSKEAREKK